MYFLDLYSTILGMGVIVNKISFLNFKLQLLIAGNNKAIEFYILITHLQLFYTSRRFWLLEIFLIWEIMKPLNKDSFISSCIICIPFSFLILLHNMECAAHCWAGIVQTIFLSCSWYQQKSVQCLTIIFKYSCRSF